MPPRGAINAQFRLFIFDSCLCLEHSLAIISLFFSLYFCTINPTFILLGVVVYLYLFPLSDFFHCSLSVCVFSFVNSRMLVDCLKLSWN